MKTRIILALAIAGTLAVGSYAQAPQSAHVKALFRSEGYPVIFSLVGRNRSLIVTKGSQGSLYCVKDASGKMLMPPSTLDEVAMNNPELYRWVNSAMAATASVDDHF